MRRHLQSMILMSATTKTHFAQIQSVDHKVLSKCTGSFQTPVFLSKEHNFILI